MRLAYVGGKWEVGVRRGVFDQFVRLDGRRKVLRFGALVGILTVPLRR